MAADDRHLRRDTAVGDRDARGGGRSRERRHTGDDLEVDARLRERECLLAAAAEDERVASLQPDDLVAPAGERDEKRVDLVLLVRVARNEDGVGSSLADELVGDEPVVDEDVAGADEREAMDRDQPGIARAGADEVDGRSQRSASSTTDSKNSRRSPYVR